MVQAYGRPCLIVNGIYEGDGTRSKLITLIGTPYWVRVSQCL
jgi:hypothetical protein